MNSRIFYIILGVFSLGLGCVMYILFRENTFISVFVSDFIPFIDDIRNLFGPLSCAFLKVYFPDFLWCFSLCFFMRVLSEKSIKGGMFAGLFSFVCGVIWEILQHKKIVSGTGDVLDIVMYFLASMVYFLIILKLEKSK